MVAPMARLLLRTESIASSKVEGMQLGAPLIDVLPAHPMITAPVAVAATGRAKAAVHQAIDQLQTAGVHPAVRVPTQSGVGSRGIA